ncbi:MAG TPA: hypothetical protein VHJ83_01460 [Micromonosporaceae bacterium]|jgi:hypothetical protein|nr:hypothetical protein [Micromonosporaceae bacterium]
MADATASNPDRASLTVAPHTARDQVTHAAGVVTETSISLVGKISRAVLADPLLPRLALWLARLMSPFIQFLEIARFTARDGPRPIAIRILDTPESTTNHDP